ncbi:uncharacterized protein LOC119573256 isoform X3 [Penaeus monodon]|uniref:uncharacterized protein LOC119573256 isoform X3 n=1 Tax=Penaeus monodon TaxID=6687 RepID=UPI0018A7954D|nr:uncharacterized protein LOC119573256 isoform X3 [Penaeus monodon]
MVFTEIRENSGFPWGQSGLTRSEQLRALHYSQVVSGTFLQGLWCMTSSVCVVGFAASRLFHSLDQPICGRQIGPARTITSPRNSSQQCYSEGCADGQIEARTMRRHAHEGTGARWPLHWASAGA